MGQSKMKLHFMPIKWISWILVKAGMKWCEDSTSKNFQHVFTSGATQQYPVESRNLASWPRGPYDLPCWSAGAVGSDMVPVSVVWLMRESTLQGICWTLQVLQMEMCRFFWVPYVLSIYPGLGLPFTNLIFLGLMINPKLAEHQIPWHSNIASCPSWVKPMKATFVVFSIPRRTGSKEGVREKGNSPQVFLIKTFCSWAAAGGVWDWYCLGLFGAYSNFCPLD